MTAASPSLRLMNPIAKRLRCSAGTNYPIATCHYGFVPLIGVLNPAGVGGKLFSQSARCSRGSVSYKSYTMPASEAVPKGKKTAYIALGSNLGDRISWIEKACNEMDARGIRVTRTSSLWETEPMYVLEQDKFVNGACEVSDTAASQLSNIVLTSGTPR